MGIAFLYRVYRTGLFVWYRSCFYSACDWIQLLAVVGCGPLVVNTVGNLLGAKWALRAIWRIVPGWFPGENEFTDIRLL